METAGALSGIHDVRTVVLAAVSRRFERALTRSSKFVLVRCPGSLEDVLAFCRQLEPCLVVLTEEMALGANRDEFQRAIDFGRTIRVVLQMRRESSEAIEGLLRLGCMGFVPEDSPPAFIRQAVEGVAAGEIWASRKVVWKLLQSLLVVERTDLTPREVQILRLIGIGAKNHEIADQLCIGLETVRWHIRSLYNKIGVHDRVSAALYARTHAMPHSELHPHKVAPRLPNVSV